MNGFYFLRLFIHSTQLCLTTAPQANRTQKHNATLPLQLQRSSRQLASQPASRTRRAAELASRLLAAAAATNSAWKWACRARREERLSGGVSCVRARAPPRDSRRDSFHFVAERLAGLLRRRRLLACELFAWKRGEQFDGGSQRAGEQAHKATTTSAGWLARNAPAKSRRQASSRDASAVHLTTSLI